MIGSVCRDGVDALPSWRAERRVLVVLPDPRRFARCLAQLPALVDLDTNDIVIAMPEEQPLWWALALAAGIGPAGVEHDDITRGQRTAIARALLRHPELDGVAVQCLAPSLSQSLADVLTGGGFAESYIITGARTTLRDRLLRRRVSRWCSAHLVALAG